MMSFASSRATAVIWVVLAMSGCMIGPNYVAPKVTPPEQWRSELFGGLTAAANAETLASWWSTLNDPLLTQLIERAVANNLDLRQAQARVREARARRGVTQADLAPTVDATGSVTRSRNSQGAGGDIQSELYMAGFDSSWELDLFGGKRRSIEAAEADLAASEEDWRDVLVSLLAEVATNYVDVRSYQARMAIAEANRDAQEETYRIALDRSNAGSTSGLAAEQAKYNLESTRSQIPTFRIGLEQGKIRLAVLLAENPGAIDADLAERKPIPTMPAEVAVGVPADSLRHRPDVRRAERQLAAETARIGVATADLYPKLSLTGSIGLESLSAGSLIRADSYFYQLGPTLQWRIFDAGRIRQNIEVEDAVTEQKLLAYQSVVLTALQEVEDAMVAYAQEQVRRENLKAAVNAAQHAVDISRDQFEAGLTDFQNVLDAQRSLLSFQEQLAESDAAVTTDLIRLYKSLGGGWESAAA
jgi:NodT family efflux transporter outer membrane factor (OMF) lipoprotein